MCNTCVGFSPRWGELMTDCRNSKHYGDSTKVSRHKLERIGNVDSAEGTGKSSDSLVERDIAHLASYIKLHTDAIE